MARIELLSERLEDFGESSTVRALRAYEGLALHPEIERAAGALYRNGTMQMLSRTQLRH